MTSLFARSKPVVGVIHVGALPGTPRSSQTVAQLVVSAREEAKIYRECDVDGVIIENMHDVPYLRGEVGPEIVAAMTAIANEVKHEGRLARALQAGQHDHRRWRLGEPQAPGLAAEFPDRCRVIPADGSPVAVRQAEIGIDLQPGWTGP